MSFVNHVIFITGMSFVNYVIFITGIKSLKCKVFLCPFHQGARCEQSSFVPSTKVRGASKVLWSLPPRCEVRGARCEVRAKFFGPFHQGARCEVRAKFFGPFTKVQGVRCEVRAKFLVPSTKVRGARCEQSSLVPSTKV